MSNQLAPPGAHPLVFDGFKGRWMIAKETVPVTYCTIQHFKSITGSPRLAELLSKAPAIEHYGVMYHRAEWLAHLFICRAEHIKEDTNMSELIAINYDDNGIPTVSGRALHEFLEVREQYPQWFNRMVEYGFSENVDFVLPEISGGLNTPKSANKIDHALTFDMAKELSMLQRTEKGKQARQYFIQIEKDFNSPEKVMARALIMADQKLKMLEEKAAVNAPKVLFAESVELTGDLITIAQLSNILKQNDIEIGEKRLYGWLRDNGYIYKDSRQPTQRALDLGVFRVVEYVYFNSQQEPKVTFTTKVTGKGQQYFVEKFLKAA